MDDAKAKKREYDKAYRIRNRERRKELNRIWRLENQERYRSHYQQWYLANKDRARDASRRWVESNKDRYLAWCAEYYQKNKAAIHARRSRHERENPEAKIARLTRAAVRRAVKLGMQYRPPGQTAAGCDSATLRAHLESKFLPGMSWENHGFRGWHIDHIRPLASFNLLDPAQAAEALHYTNLQPLWWKDNLRKNKLTPATSRA